MTRPQPATPVAPPLDRIALVSANMKAHSTAAYFGKLL